MATMESPTAKLTETALKKLTVPQLKLLCKERRLVGYSKLAKDNLVQKLLSTQAASGLGNPLATTSSPASKIKENSVSTDLSNGESNSNHEARIAEKATTIGDLAKEPLPSTLSYQTGGRSTIHLHPQQQTHMGDTSSNGTKIDVQNNYDVGSTKKLGATTHDISTPERIRLNILRPTSNVLCSEGVSSLSATSGSKKSEFMSVSGLPTLSNSVVKSNGNRRFKPLMPSSAGGIDMKARLSMHSLHPIQPDPTDAVSIREVNGESTHLGQGPSGTGLEHLNFAPEQPVSMTTILFPPSMAQRKHIPSLSLILSGISIDDLKTCALVSRAFRYAAYISASHQLSRRFQGKRLQEILCRYSSKVTDMWPYLLLREREALSRRTTYEKSFLSKALIGIAEVGTHLWDSPNHERQIIIALRFLTTKLYFLLSTGHGYDEYNTKGKPGRILDVCEVVKNEIWKITYSSSTGIQIFHVLEDTCEVIGDSTYYSGVPTALAPVPHGIRNDWQAYIDEASARKDICTHGGLLEHLQWSNHEEYDKGISKVWLKRIQAEGKVGAVKHTLAMRYVLACVVANSISGPWRTANEMAQEFDGRGNVHIMPKKQVKKLNLFLPMHHHIESVHFTSSNGGTLHEALAVVQTPGREYFVLRDNGMQVGCEEDGVALIWMETLGCSSNGCVR